MHLTIKADNTVKTVALIASFLCMLGLSSAAFADSTNADFTLHVVALPSKDHGTPTLRYDVTNVSPTTQNTIWHTYILPQSFKIAGVGPLYATRFALCKHKSAIGSAPYGVPLDSQPLVTLAPGQTHSYFDSSSLCDWDFSHPGIYEGYGELQGGPPTSSSSHLVNLTAKWSLTVK